MRDSFNLGKAVEEDQVKTMGPGSSVRWPAVEAEKAHNHLSLEHLTEWQFWQQQQKKVI